MRLENIVQELRNQLAESQRAANEQKDSSNEFIRSLRADLRTQESNSSAFIVTLIVFCYLCSSDQKIASLNTAVQELRNQLATSQRTANQEKDRVNETINSLRSDLHAHDESSSASISTETYVSLTSMFTRQDNHTSRTGQPRTPHPTCRRPTQSRWSQSCTRAEASMRIPVFPRPRTGCCGMSS